MVPRHLLLRAGLLSVLAAVSLPAHALAKNYLGHDRSRPLPPVVSPAVPSTDREVGKAPSDAIVLFDGSGLSAWAAMDGKPTQWVIKDGAMECVPGAGYIRSIEAFGACQLHVEFATPAKVEGKSQGRGNSGVFFGMGRYEIQVLDSHQNPTYADGSAASIYNQYPPEVNASRAPGEWQTYDIVWTPPTFDASGKNTAPAYVTVFHNGVLVHYHRALMGETGWLTRNPFTAHADKLPIAFQDHGNPVRYRNVWVRPLDGGRREIYLPPAALDRFVGKYRGDLTIEREGDQLVAVAYTMRVPLAAASPTVFFNKEVDIEITFADDAKWVKMSVGGEPDSERPRL